MLKTLLPNYEVLVKNIMLRNEKELKSNGSIGDNGKDIMKDYKE